MIKIRSCTSDTVLESGQVGYSLDSHNACSMSVGNGTTEFGNLPHIRGGVAVD